jgi:hypothetical protein
MLFQTDQQSGIVMQTDGQKNNCDPGLLIFSDLMDKKPDHKGKGGRNEANANIRIGAVFHSYSPLDSIENFVLPVGII